jgi:hypothetical protein
MSAFSGSAGSNKPQRFADMSRGLKELTRDLFHSRKDKGGKKVVEAKLRLLLTSSSVNTVNTDGSPLVAWIARDDPSLLPVALTWNQTRT